jgi:hypothetical protein
MALFGACVRLAVGLVLLFGVGAGASMALSQDDTSSDCELGISFKVDIERTDWIQLETLEILPLIDPAAKAWLRERHLYHEENWLSPDSTRLIVYELPADPTAPVPFFIFDLTTASLTPIMFDTTPYAPSYIDNLDFVWSPDGTQIAYLALLRAYVLDVTTGENWILVNLQDPEIIERFSIPPNEGYFDQRTSTIQWSPDGQRLILTYEDEIRRAIMVDVDGSNLHWALPTGGADYSPIPTWGESSDILYYVCQTTAICMMDIAHNLDVEFMNVYEAIDELPSQIDVSSNGMMLFSFSQLIEHPNFVTHLAVLDLETQEITDLFPTIGRVWETPPHWYCHPIPFGGA